MIIPYLILSCLGWLCVGVVFERLYEHLKPDCRGRLPKHTWCWIWWATLGVLAFACGGQGGLIQMAMVFCIAAGHIALCETKESYASLKEIVASIPPGLRAVYQRFRNMCSGKGV